MWPLFPIDGIAHGCWVVCVCGQRLVGRLHPSLPVPNNAYPFSFRPHYAQYVDPITGNVSKIIVVPAAMGMSWQDGYECYGPNDMETIAAGSDPAHPNLVLLAHDGDNDFGGGYSYYTQCVSGLVSAAASQGIEATTIQQYLSDFPVDPNDIVHVEVRYRC
jgi:hypothetical protein